MIEFSANNFITTLINIITGSPTSFLFIIFGIIFTIAMIINIKKKKTIGKSLFIIGWIFIIGFIIVKYNSYLTKIFDNMINTIFVQIFFPNLATYIIIVILTNIIFLYTILNKKTTNISKINNYIFFSIIMVLMIFTLEQIIENKINIYEKTELYTNKKILTLIEATTIVFTIWIIIITSKLLIKKLISKSTEKILNEAKEKANVDQNSQPKTPEPITAPTPIQVQKLVEPQAPTQVQEPIQNKSVITPAPIQVQEPIQNEPVITPVTTQVQEPIQSEPVITSAPIQPIQSEPVITPVTTQVQEPIQSEPVITSAPIQPIQSEPVITPAPIQVQEPIQSEPVIINGPKQINNPSIFDQTIDNTNQNNEIETLTIK